MRPVGAFPATDLGAHPSNEKSSPRPRSGLTYSAVQYDAEITKTTVLGQTEITTTIVLQPIELLQLQYYNIRNHHYYVLLQHKRSICPYE